MGDSEGEDLMVTCALLFCEVVLSAVPISIVNLGTRKGRSQRFQTGDDRNTEAHRSGRPSVELGHLLCLAYILTRLQLTSVNDAWGIFSLSV